MSFHKLVGPVGLGFAALALCGGALPAQFPGDVYFPQPSAVVAAGGVAELVVEAYLGSAPLGAAQFAIEFQAARAEAVGFTLPSGEELRDRGAVAIEPGRLAVVLYNERSLQRPFGTVQLGVLRLRPLVAPGQQVALQIRVQSLLTTATVPLPQIRGLAGTVGVTSGGTSPLVLESGAPVVGPVVGGVEASQVAWGELVQPWRERVLGLARPGALVRVRVPVWIGAGFTWVEVVVGLPPVVDGDAVGAGGGR